MARPVQHDAAEESILDPTYYFPPDKVDCWHIALAAGDYHKFWENDTLNLPYVSWQKRNKLKVYPMHKIKNRMLS